MQGIDDHFLLEKEEMYGEFFDVPEPLETIMISSFAGGEVFRSLCTWTRGAGKIVYFRPGHESVPHLPPPADPAHHRKRLPLGRPHPAADAGPLRALRGGMAAAPGQGAAVVVDADPRFDVNNPLPGVLRRIPEFARSGWRPFLLTTALGANSLKVGAVGSGE